MICLTLQRGSCKDRKQTGKMIWTERRKLVTMLMAVKTTDNSIPYFPFFLNVDIKKFMLYSAPLESVSATYKTSWMMKENFCISEAHHLLHKILLGASFTSSQSHDPSFFLRTIDITERSCIIMLTAFSLLS